MEKQCEELEESISTLTASDWAQNPNKQKCLLYIPFFLWEGKCVGYAVISRENGPTHPTSEYTLAVFANLLAWFCLHNSAHTRVCSFSSTFRFPLDFAMHIFSFSMVPTGSVRLCSDMLLCDFFWHKMFANRNP